MKNNINKYISHISAAYRWNIPYLNEVLGSEILNTNQPDEITDITITDPSRVYSKKGYRVHSRSRSLPRNSLASKDCEIISSPELIFLELANVLDIHRLILLGLQLCSYPVGKPEYAITTKRKLQSFIDKTHGFHGHINATIALKYLENGSASIMESIVYMVLTLPHSLGGYGLSGSVFNHEVPLGKRGEKLMGQTRCFVDLYYKDSKCVVEYDSYKFHSNPTAQYKDQQRSFFLFKKKIKVFSLTTMELYDKDECRTFAFWLAKSLGKRIRIRTKKFEQAHESLRKILP